MSSLERIVAGVGGDLFDGGRRALIPGPGHGPNDRSVSLLLDRRGRIIVHCFSPRDDWRDVRDALASRGWLSQAEADVREGARWTHAAPTTGATRTRGVERARCFWSESIPLHGTLGERYLCVRGIVRERAARDELRFHPRMSSVDDRRRRPALVAAIRSGAGRVQGVEVTLLTDTGDAKAVVRTPRRIVGRLLGGSVQLDEAGETLLVGEGVATVLSASEVFSLNAWALLSGHNLARFTPPAAVQRLVVAFDRDRAGWCAARRLASRVAGAVDVEFAAPPLGFNDWNDYARAG